MPLNASERVSFAESLLRLFGEDYFACGRTLKFMQAFTVGNVNLLAEVQTRATTWQPFIDSGLSIEWWKGELARVFNETQTT